MLAYLKLTSLTQKSSKSRIRSLPLFPKVRPRSKNRGLLIQVHIILRVSYVGLICNPRAVPSSMELLRSLRPSFQVGVSMHGC